ncbi:MAG: MATE family efflux transporter [Eubacteriaceae bacterium]|nr:MATE family efflux transporter [Eubacteriaceae bacterium]
MEGMFENGVSPKKFTGFVFPSIVMMIVLSLYYTIDAILVANYAGDDALATLSIAYPVMGIVWGVSVMLAAGSSAIVAMKLGMRKFREANEKFTQIIIVALILSAIMILLFNVFMDPIVGFLGATGKLTPLCSSYLKILVWCTPAAFAGVVFEYYIRVDGHPTFTLFLYLFSGAVHIITAWILMGKFGWGIEGAALGTVVGMWMSAVIGFIYFISGKSKLKFAGSKKPDWHYIGHSMVNGSSELVSEASDGIMTFFFNMIMLRLAGPPGVAALSVVLSIHYCFISLHIGYITGLAPLISYYYGAKDYKKINTFIKYSRNFIIVSSVALTLLCWFGAPALVSIFDDPGSEVYELSVHGMRILSPVFILVGLTIFSSGFFTAYGNGQISALISLSRTLIAVIAFAFLLSALFGIDGLWLAPFAAEAVTAVMAVFIFRKYKGKYHYSLK